MNLSTSIAGIPLKNPITTASGTFGFGFDFEKIQNFENNKLGGIVLKGTTLHAREGNPTPRIVETCGGILNAIGLQNPGIEKVLTDYLPRLENCGTKIILNLAGSCFEDYVDVCKELKDNTIVDGVELNISCPNVKEGGIQFGAVPALTEKVVKGVKEILDIPLIVKLSPNVTDITEIAAAALHGGADALSLINTYTGMAIDIKSRKPILGNRMGGLSGPAIKPLALYQIDKLHQWKVKNNHSFDILGMGGIVDEEDILEFIMAGASAVSLGTSLFVYQLSIDELIRNLENKMRELGINSIEEIIGCLP